MTNRVQGARYSGSSMKYLPGELRWAAAYCNSSGASTCVNRPTKLFQKNTFKRAAPSGPTYTNPTHVKIIAACKTSPRYSSQRRSSRQRFSQSASVTRANAGTIQATALLQRKPKPRAACINR